MFLLSLTKPTTREIRHPRKHPASSSSRENPSKSVACPREKVNCDSRKERFVKNVTKRVTGRVAWRMPRDHSNAARFESGSRVFQRISVTTEGSKKPSAAFSRAHVTGRMHAGNKGNANRKLREWLLLFLSSPAARISERRKRAELGKRSYIARRSVRRLGD